MNFVNPDLTFTVEVASDFEDKRLPTLDFSMWMRKDMTLTHSYFEKDMKSQQMLHRDSAMGKKQKFCIQANELTRRLQNIDEEDEEVAETEVVKTIEDYTRQVKNSGWDRREAWEMVTSGYAGWIRRKRKRLREGQDTYRSAAASLPSRARRKLVGKEEWFRQKKERENDEFDTYERKGKKRKRDTNEGTEEDEVKVVSVMFVPFSTNGELARRMKEAENELGKQMGVKIKVVEKTGTRLVDLLHKSDPWQGEDCQRPLCILCKTKVESGKQTRQDCTQRCIVYETWCITCEQRSKEEIENEVEDEKERNRRMKEVPLYKYIGESSRSMYERGLEYQRDYEEMKKDSHMLKHYLDKHAGEEFEKMKFGARIVKKIKVRFQ